MFQQKIKIGWMDTKQDPYIYILSKRIPLQT